MSEGNYSADRLPRRFTRGVGDVARFVGGTVSGVGVMFLDLDLGERLLTHAGQTRTAEKLTEFFTLPEVSDPAVVANPAPNADQEL